MILETRREEVAPGRWLRVARLGSGPPLVLLHGYPENLQIWSALAPFLAERFEVIAFDWPGLGYSDGWPGGATPQHLAERLLRLVERWGLERITLVGFDMGGQPALAFAALYPAKVERLVVMNSLVFGAARTSWEIRLLRRFAINRLLLRHFPRLIFWRAEHTFLPWGKRIPKALRMDFWNAFRRREVRDFLVKMCAGYQGRLDTLPALYGQIRCPVLVAWGGADKHFPPSQGERLHAAIPGSRLQIVARAGHWMPWDHASELNAAIRELAARG
jgi:pimeloyl-ACP methyl ester carboxylesterase